MVEGVAGHTDQGGEVFRLFGQSYTSRQLVVVEEGLTVGICRTLDATSESGHTL